MAHLAPPLLLACLGLAALAAGEATAALRDGGRQAADLLPEIASAIACPIRLDPRLLDGGAALKRPRFTLASADRGAALQALAWSLGCRWCDDPDEAKGVLLLPADAPLPLGALHGRSWSSGIRDPRAEALAEHLLGPWITGRAGLAQLPAEGMWSATLDAAGAARMSELLDALERPQARAPHLLPRDAVPVGALPAVPAGTWEALLARLDGLCSIALAPGLVAGEAPPFAGGGVDALIGLLRGRGFPTASIDGVLCIGLAAESAPAEHPAQRRRLAVLPIGHLVLDQAGAELLLLRLRQTVRPQAWSQAGWGLEVHPSGSWLLVAGDPPSIHAVMDAIDAIDHAGALGGARPQLVPSGP